MVLQWVKRKKRGRGGGRVKQANSLINTWEPAEPIYLRLTLSLSLSLKHTHTLFFLVQSILQHTHTHALCLSCSSLQKFLYNIFCTVCSRHFTLPLSLSPTHTYTHTLSFSLYHTHTHTHNTIRLCQMAWGRRQRDFFIFFLFHFSFLYPPPPFWGVSVWVERGGVCPPAPPPFPKKVSKWKEKKIFYFYSELVA